MWTYYIHHAWSGVTRNSESLLFPDSLSGSVDAKCQLLPL
jgi:hypothetical protein